MARITHTVTNILFDSLDELFVAAAKYLKRRLVKQSIDEFTPFIGKIVAADIEASTGWSLDDQIEDLTAELQDVGLTSCREGTELGEICDFDHARNVISLGGAVEIQQNCLGLHCVVTHNGSFDNAVECWTTGAVFQRLLSMAVDGKLAILCDGDFMEILEVETKDLYFSLKRQVTEEGAGETPEATSTEVALEVVSAENVEAVLEPAQQPATKITLRLPAEAPMSAEQRAGVEPTTGDQQNG